MTQLIIDIGDAPNDGTGDSVRDAFNKCNNNFSELYAADAAGGGGTATPVPPQGRLTLQTAVPVMTTTQSAKTTIFYTPYIGGMVPIYDGTNMVMTTFAELSVATTDTTKSPAAIGASKVNDWFVWNDSGTIRIGHGPDWTSDTARSAGTALVMVNGILLNNAAITNGPAVQRGTYAGTTRSNGSSQLDYIFGATGTAAFLGVWNCYNRVLVQTTCAQSATTWSYSSATIRASNNTAIERISFVSGLAEDGVMTAHSRRIDPAGTGYALLGIALDATNAQNKYILLALANSTVGLNLAYPPQLGFHYIQATEAGDGTTSSTFYGDNAAMLTMTWNA
jgi:hypothetical protein